MKEIIDRIGIENMLLILGMVVGILFIGFLIIIISNIRLKSRYKKFISKIGNSDNIENDLKNFMDAVNKVQEQNEGLVKYYKNIDDRVTKCIQKIGIVRYNAYKDTGSDLSFAVALLDDNNNGIVFNGIYSREMSNIYSKPVENGNSKYTLSEEEVKAIDKAINSNSI